MGSIGHLDPRGATPVAGKAVTYSPSITLALTHECHNRCAYCGYRRPASGVMTLESVAEVVRRGQAAGCRELLLLSGERPWCEEGFPLDEAAFIDLAYAACLTALRAGMLPHANIGLLSRADLARLREVNASMGLMLETANRLLPAHASRPGKDVDERIRHIAEAGELRIPFTTGILVGIGESVHDRIEALRTIAGLHRRHGHIQEVIIQNFQPKPGTPMASWPPPGEPEMKELVRKAVELLPGVAIQVPPNLNERYVDLLDAGATDLGGISPESDAVNPERHWPAVTEMRERLSDRGYVLRERLPVHPDVDADLAPVADRLRRELVGDTVTYVVNCNINFTNVCTGDCRFCAYRVTRDDPGAFQLSIPEVVAKARVAIREGASEVCIQGGLHPRLRLDFYAGMLRALKSEFPALHTHAFSPMEVLTLAQKERVSVAEVLAELRRAGLDSMPGTAAEILVDKVRAQICPHKMKTAEWVAVVKQAHRLGLPTTATMMFGHVETWADRVEHLQVILDIQRETGGFTEFVLLPFVPWNTGLGRQHGIEPLSMNEVLKVTAYARLFFGKELVNIQGSWVKTGVEGVQMALQSGANDFGGTLMEENISRSAGAPFGERLTREEIETAIRAIGRFPVERDTLYNFRPVESRGAACQP